MKKEYIYEASRALKDFLIYMETIQGKSELTVNVYYTDLRMFFRYMKKIRGLVNEDMRFDEIPVNDVDIDFIRTVTFADIKSFMNYCLEERGNKAAARSRKCSVLNTFFGYLEKKEKLIECSPTKDIDFPKKAKVLPKYLSLDQSIDLLRAVEGEYKERDYCILTLFLNCGMRLSELVGIDITDIGEDGSLRIFGKGRKERVVYLNEACIYALSEYMKVRPESDEENKNALFISKRKRRISIQTVQFMVYKYIDKIGLGEQGYSVHKLRHTAATLMYQHGHVDIRVLKEILGHENIDTTEIYTHLSSVQVKSAIAANPLANFMDTSKKAVGNTNC